MSRIIIAHDYLLQYGGAERVTAIWAEHLPASEIYTLAYDDQQTYPVFTSRAVNSAVKHPVLMKHIDALLPALPSISKRITVPEADLSLVSTSGWAHHFCYESKTLAYVHSPARWLYAKADYSKKLGRAKQLGLTMTASYLRREDQRAMRKMTGLVANSRVSQSRIKEAYGVAAPIVHPPVEPPATQEATISTVLPDVYSLVVSRNRGYKNVGTAVGASVRAGLACVVVGAGSEQHSSPTEGVIGLGRVTDEQLLWLYRRATVIIGSANEDFGLTILEANREGTPSAAIPVGGYLETVAAEKSGILATADDVHSLAVAIERARHLERDGVADWSREFSASQHMRSLLDVAGSI